MSEVKWTPGPWEIGSYLNYEGFSIAAKGRGCIAERWWPSRLSDDFNPEAMANANLIAAAPDLYEALAEAVLQCGCTLRERESGHLVECFVPKARAALKKARGEA